MSSGNIFSAGSRFFKQHIFDVDLALDTRPFLSTPTSGIPVVISPAQPEPSHQPWQWNISSNIASTQNDLLTSLTDRQILLYILTFLRPIKITFYATPPRPAPARRLTMYTAYRDKTW